MLILRDVLGFSGAEVAEALHTTPDCVYSLLQRANASLGGRLAHRSQRATLRSLGDAQLSVIVDRYVEAWVQNDVKAIVEMLTESAAPAMPATPSRYRDPDAITTAQRADL